MIAEDPTLVVEHDPTVNETVLRGLGRPAPALGARAHGEPVQARGRHAAAARALSRDDHGARPRVIIGTRSRPAARASSARCILRIEPLPRGTGFEFVDQVKGGAIPNTLIPAVQKGVEQVLTAGPVAGFPMQDVRVIVYDGKYHPVDSKEVAFVSAGRKAFLDAIAKARPIVLEPIVGVEINCPARHDGRRHRRPVVAPRTGDRHEDDAGRHARRERTRAAVGARRLRGAPQVDDRRPRRVDDGAVALRAGAAESAAASSRPSTRSIGGTKRSDDAASGRRGAPFAKRMGIDDKRESA